MTTDPGPRDPQTFAIIGAAMAVHTELGCGFLESVYRNAMLVELEGRRIPSARKCRSRSNTGTARCR